MRNTCLNTVYELAKNNENIVFIGSDLGYKTLDSFREERPNQFFMEGICEAAIVGMSAGFALEGKIVYVNTIASFLTRRAYEQVVIDLCMHNANVRLIGNGAGLVYAPLGPTHQTIEDISIMRSLPNMAVVAPADAHEMDLMVRATENHKGPLYIRMAKGYDQVVTKNTLEKFELGKIYSYANGKDAVVFTTGITLQVALEAKELLARDGINISIAHMPTIKPVKSEEIKTILSDFNVILTVEEHSIIGGLGSHVADIFAESNFDRKQFKKIGLADEFALNYGSQKQLMNHYGVSAENISNSIKNFLR